MLPLNDNENKLDHGAQALQHLTLSPSVTFLLSSQRPPH